MAMKATKTELRLYTVAVIIAVDTALSSAERVYFDGVVNQTTMHVIVEGFIDL